MKQIIGVMIRSLVLREWWSPTVAVPETFASAFSSSSFLKKAQCSIEENSHLLFFLVFWILWGKNGGIRWANMSPGHPLLLISKDVGCTFQEDQE